ncbi:hypothetical protein [Microbacterium sp. Leaf203]|uniref:hypothetical protein n=1 Tax=Microbacterium sp. Leaf203 TaxID=1735677 RepID=UPI0012E23C0D|nr:hypothetical protein [Microbacterium sp. Leaf203]
MALNLHEQLVNRLGEICEVSRIDAVAYNLRPRNASDVRPVEFIAPPPALEKYLHRTASDALLALGEVGDDPSGVTAALALLVVHVEEEIYVDSQTDLLAIEVTPESLNVTRSNPIHR